MSVAGSESALFVAPKSMFSSKSIDYLSHDIGIEELHNCWRFIENEELDTVTKTRICNVCWRRFFKTMFSIGKANPKILNWKIKNDTTWLYGPLFGSVSPDRKKVVKPQAYTSQSNSGRLDLAECAPAPGSILKKKTETEIFLKSLLSTGSGYFLMRARKRSKQKCNDTHYNSQGSFGSIERLWEMQSNFNVSSQLGKVVSKSKPSVRFSTDIIDDCMVPASKEISPVKNFKSVMDLCFVDYSRYNHDWNIDNSLMNANDVDLLTSKVNDEYGILHYYYAANTANHIDQNANIYIKGQRCASKMDQEDDFFSNTLDINSNKKDVYLNSGITNSCNRLSRLIDSVLEKF